MGKSKVIIEATGDSKDILKALIDQEDITPVVLGFFKNNQFGVATYFPKDNDRLGPQIHTYLKNILLQMQKEMTEDN